MQRAIPGWCARWTGVAAVALGTLTTACAADEFDTTDLDALAAEVVEVRGLSVAEPLESRILAPDEFDDRVMSILEEREGTSQAAADVAAEVLVRLRHLDPGVDLAAVTEDLVEGGGVGGIYVPEEGVFYVRADGEVLGPLEEVTAAHEVTHALQDRIFGLDRLLELQQGDDPDEFLGLNALVEGDAQVTMERWSREHQDPEARTEYFAEITEAAQADAAMLDQLPPYLIQQLQFSYVDGEAFVESLLDDGGWDAVDDAYDEPPATSAEILHPERYLEGFEPIDAPLGGDPGEGWEVALRYPYGAFDLFALLAADDPVRAAEATAAWVGGELALWRDGDRTALGVRLAFDDPEVADAVCAGVPSWYEAAADGAPTAEGEGSAEHWRSGDDLDDVLAVTCSEEDVRFGLAPDGQAADAVVAGG